jgi:hypothetical protein
MQNTALNHLKCSFPATKDRRVVLNLFASSQAAFKSQVMQFVFDKNKDAKDRKIVLKCFLRPIDSELPDNLPSNVSVQNVSPKELLNDSAAFAFGSDDEKSDAAVLVISGMEMYSWFATPEKLREQMRILKSKDFSEKLKIIHLFCFGDQFATLKHLAVLKEESTFLINFSKATNLNKFTVDCVSYQESANPSKEKISGSMKNGLLSFEKYVPQNHIVEKKNPDQLIKSTFKLGLSEEQKAEKDRQILPFYKQKQIEEMRKKESDDIDEQFDLGIDDEQDEDDDFDV